MRAATAFPLARDLPKYWAVFRTQLINSFAYPADLFARSITMLLFMWIFAQLWRTTYAAAGQSVIAGLTLRETLWYLMLAETIMLSKPLMSRAIAEQVKDGSIAYLLNKPYNFLLYQFSHSLGDGFLRILTNALFGSILVQWLAGPPPGITGWLMVLPAVALAWGIDFCLNAMIGMLAFLTEEIRAFEWLYSKFLLILGGTLIPLDFFPDWLRSFALSLPFAYTVYAPARLFVQPELSRFLILLGQQAAWLLGLAIVLALLYRKATSWLAINGG